MAVSSLGMLEALRVVKVGRRIANPNPGFLRQLEEWVVGGGEEREKRRLRKKFYNQRNQEDEDSVQE